MVKGRQKLVNRARVLLRAVVFT